jgi:hypothetical protein
MAKPRFSVAIVESDSYDGRVSVVSLNPYFGERFLSLSRFLCIFRNKGETSIFCCRCCIWFIWWPSWRNLKFFSFWRTFP